MLNSTKKFCYAASSFPSCSDEILLTSLCPDTVRTAVVTWIWVSIVIAFRVICCTVCLPLLILGVVFVVFFGGLAIVATSAGSSDSPGHVYHTHSSTTTVAAEPHLYQHAPMQPPGFAAGPHPQPGSYQTAGYQPPQYV